MIDQPEDASDILTPSVVARLAGRYNRPALVLEHPAADPDGAEADERRAARLRELEARKGATK